MDFEHINYKYLIYDQHGLFCQQMGLKKHYWNILLLLKWIVTTDSNGNGLMNMWRICCVSQKVSQVLWERGGDNKMMGWKSALWQNREDLEVGQGKPGWKWWSTISRECVWSPCMYGTRKNGGKQHGGGNWLTVQIRPVKWP